MRLDTSRLRVEKVRHKPAPHINTLHIKYWKEGPYAILRGIGRVGGCNYGLRTEIDGG
jgi:hypothetical protein